MQKVWTAPGYGASSCSAGERYQPALLICHAQSGFTSELPRRLRRQVAREHTPKLTLECVMPQKRSKKSSVISSVVPPNRIQSSLASERHYSISEVAALWNLSDDTIRSLFRDRTDVIKLGNQERRHKRGYLSLRIPESVLQKVHSDLRGRVA